MYKLLKNKSKKNLHSDAELKGRGMRKKLQYNEDKNNTQGLFANLSSDSADSSDAFHLNVKPMSSSKHQLEYPNFPSKKRGINIIIAR